MSDSPAESVNIDTTSEEVAMVLMEVPKCKECEGTGTLYSPPPGNKVGKDREHDCPYCGGSGWEKL